MVSDSVGLGAKPQMTAAFPAGWQVTITGKAGLFTETLASNYVRYQPQYQFGDEAIVATGYNYPYWDPPRFDRAIDLMVDTLLAKGVKRVFWVTMREVKPEYFSGWNSLTSAYRTLYLAYPAANDQLRAAQARHPELSIIDWADITDQFGLTYDAIHLNPTGAALYSQLAATTVLGARSRMPAGTITEIAVAGAGGVPADIAAASVNLTVVNPRTNGFLTAYPCGTTRPVASNLNFRASQTIAAAAIVAPGDGGKICVYQHTEAHVIVDLNGTFTATSGLTGITPFRAVDTRGGPLQAANAPRVVDLSAVPGLPVDAASVVVNVTATEGLLGGNLSVFACDQPAPAQPNRQYRARVVAPVLAIVGVSAARTICVVASQATHLIVDVFAGFAPTADVHPVSTTRIIDSRSGLKPGAGGVLFDRVHDSIGVTSLPTGVVATVTLYNAVARGFASAYPCAPGRPDASLLNVVPNRTQANASTIALDWDGWMCVYVHVAAHVTVDVSAWLGVGFESLVPVRLFDSRPT